MNLYVNLLVESRTERWRARIGLVVSLPSPWLLC